MCMQKYERLSDSDVILDLPQDLINDIFLRLPVKSIGKCRCVAKPWCSLLSSPQFIKTHLSRRASLPQQNLLLYGSSSLSTFTLQPSDEVRDAVSRKFDFAPIKRVDVLTLVGSCDGMVLVILEGDIKVLINPITSQQLKLPIYPLADLSNCTSFLYGFGYDRSHDDYKIVSISFNDMAYGYDLDFSETYVDIYSVKTSSWRRQGTSPYDHSEAASGVFLDGALHWVVHRKYPHCGSVIAAFSLSSEEFKEISPPKCLDKDMHSTSFMLLGLEGCLGLVVNHFIAGKMDVWTMKRYGVAESWTKMTIDVTDGYWRKPLCLRRHELLFLEGRNIKHYHLKDKRWDASMINHDKDWFEIGMLFTESLVSPYFNSRRIGPPK